MLEYACLIEIYSKEKKENLTFGSYYQSTESLLSSFVFFLFNDFQHLSGTFELIEDESRSGACLWVTSRRGLEYWPTPAEEKKYLVRRSKRNFSSPNFSSITMPQSFEKM
jgi:uncharacterized protein YfbU (UPF0304 family)